jgi:hypothetical protein
MDSLPHELLVRVCTFLCTASLCRLCGASKALRIALKDDPNAWENALQSTWWYPIDTLKRHDNFTFWCSCYSIRTRLSLNRQIRDRAHIDFQLAVVSYQGEVIGTCFLDEMELASDDIPQPGLRNGPEGNDRIYLHWVACGEFACSTFLSSKDTIDQVTLDIFTVFKDKIHFTTKYSTKYSFKVKPAYSQFDSQFEGPEIEFNGDVCTVEFHLCELVEDLYNNLNRYLNGHEPEKFFENFNHHRPFIGNGQYCILNDFFLESEKRTRRGWGNTRKFIREKIIDLCCEEEHLITFETTLPPGMYEYDDSFMVTLPSGKLLELTVPKIVLFDRKIQFEVPERDAMPEA